QQQQPTTTAAAAAAASPPPGPPCPPLGPGSLLPGPLSVCTLDVLVARVQVTLDRLFAGSALDGGGGAAAAAVVAAATAAVPVTPAVVTVATPAVAATVAAGLLPVVLKLVELYAGYCRWYVLGKLGEEEEEVEEKTLSYETLCAYAAVLEAGPGRTVKSLVPGPALARALPPLVVALCDLWDAVGTHDFPTLGAWRHAYTSEPPAPPALPAPPRPRPPHGPPHGPPRGPPPRRATPGRCRRRTWRCWGAVRWRSPPPSSTP
ncbi:E3 ubiquitin-protein ligase UBR4-like, partial [Lampetra fluviatilis]